MTQKAKESTMEVTSSAQTPIPSSETENLKKSLDMQEKETAKALKAVEAANEESQKAASQKTGLGTNLNIAG